MTNETDKMDMGPFAGMDQALVRAITGYGTPPYRQTAQVRVRDVDGCSFDSLPLTIEGWIEWLSDARDDVPVEYRGAINSVLEQEYGYGDGDSASFKIWYERPETDQEMTERVNRGIAYITRQAEDEMRQFLALKAKFEPPK